MIRRLLVGEEAGCWSGVGLDVHQSGKPASYVYEMVETRNESQDRSSCM